MNFFARLITAIKKVMLKMSLIKDISNVADLSAVQITQGQYNRIIEWKHLYRGHLKKYDNRPFHELPDYDLAHGRHYRRIASMNMPKVLCERMASLVFNDKCLINVSTHTDGEGDTQPQQESQRPDPWSDYVHEIFERSNFYKREQNYLEYGFAEGGHVIKVNMQDNKIYLTFATAENFLPTQITNGHVDAGVFLSETQKGNKYYTLLEWHQWQGTTYQIINQLYMSVTEGDLGTQVPLADLYPDMESEIDLPGLERPLFAYIRPNIANNFDTNSPLGVSLFANAIDTLHSIDIAFDSFQREFILGKRRILVPQSAIHKVIDPMTKKVHRYFDESDAVFQAYEFGDRSENEKIQEMDATLRVDEHVSAINALLNMLAAQTGFSPGTFYFAGGSVVQTATQVISENSATFQTKCSHETLLEQGIREIVDAIAALSRQYNLTEVPDDYDVTVQFDDSVAEDKTAMAQNMITQVNAGVLSKITAMMRINGWTREQAEQELQQIQQEQPKAPDMSGLFGPQETSNQGEGQ